MNWKKILAILLGKLIIILTKTLKMGGGSAAPGYYALRLYPQLVSDLASNIPKTVIITGTNGKTTTARMLAHFAQHQGLKVLRNSTGSNLERGIASALISASHIGSGKLKNYDLAIWELDEAAFNAVAPKLNPQITVFLNVFRDQLDRYGEVDTVVKKWCQTLKNLDKKGIILINGDDDNLLELKKCFKGNSATFGVKDFKIYGEKKEATKVNLDFEAKDVQLKGLGGSKFGLKLEGEEWSFSLPLPGTYHIYDFLAAIAAAHKLELAPAAIIDSFEDFVPAFGRVEKFSFTPSRCQAKKEGYILLIKNPTGTTQVLQILKNELRKDDQLILALNDKLADGTDVSWIWDADFEILNTMNSYPQIICSGTRSEDMALRLKYAGIDQNTISIKKSLKEALEGSKRQENGRLFILPTYTALLELQKNLTQAGIKKHYWREN